MHVISGRQVVGGTGVLERGGLNLLCPPPKRLALTGSCTGHIPRRLGDLGALQGLGLSYNKLDGKLEIDVDRRFLTL